jgi:hypothetical protein
VKSIPLDEVARRRGMPHIPLGGFLLEGQGTFALEAEGEVGEGGGGGALQGGDDEETGFRTWFEFIWAERIGYGTQVSVETKTFKNSAGTIHKLKNSAFWRKIRNKVQAGTTPGKGADLLIQAW